MTAPTLAAGQSVDFSVTATAQGVAVNLGDNVTVTADNDTVAALTFEASSGTGRVDAKAEGTVVLTVSVPVSGGDLQAQETITVTAVPVEEPAAPAEPDEIGLSFGTPYPTPA